MTSLAIEQPVRVISTIVPANVSASRVVVDQISKGFGSVQVLRNVSLEIEKGEFLTLLGPSGCGKSTLLRIIAGLEQQDIGHITIGSRRVDDIRPKGRDVAMVFQSYALYPHMTAAANMALPLRMRRLSKAQRLPLIGRLLPETTKIEAEIANEVSQVAAAIGIDHLLDRKPAHLSGGQRQRVAVGRAMVRHPSVFLMDEPLSSLDAKLRVQMRSEIKDLHRRVGATFVYVTHDQAEAMTMSDRVAVMKDGEILQVASPVEIYAAPANIGVAEFVGSPKINLLPGLAVDRRHININAATIAVNVDMPRGCKATIGIRPEAFQIAPRAEAGALTGITRTVEHMGADLYAHLDVDGLTNPIVVRLFPEAVPNLAPGQRLHLTAQPERILVFDESGVRISSAGIASMRSVR